ncbi:putative glycoprotein 2 [Coredo virus]|uniref:Putative glycoprotein 2 n=1 Tax=Coredo virus TaxID=2689366 RepID=A0A6B9KP85_9VIRU|nr:putative glycoprotein 2 [Coredo virus]QHA33849.1 putative glycoprotein 2 [Coredo virus]
MGVRSSNPPPKGNNDAEIPGEGFDYEYYEEVGEEEAIYDEDHDATPTGDLEGAVGGEFVPTLLSEDSVLEIPGQLTPVKSDIPEPIAGPSRASDKKSVGFKSLDEFIIPGAGKYPNCLKHGPGCKNAKYMYSFPECLCGGEFRKPRHDKSHKSDWHMCVDCLMIAFNAHGTPMSTIARALMRRSVGKEYVDTLLNVWGMKLSENKLALALLLTVNGGTYYHRALCSNLIGCAPTLNAVQIHIAKFHVVPPVPTTAPAVEDKNADAAKSTAAAARSPDESKTPDKTE